MQTASDKSRYPTWWKPDHQTGWDRVKAAFQRDWEQTKADMSAGRKGADLNQQVGDTVQQALGNERIPPPGIANPLSPSQVEHKFAKPEKERVRETPENPQQWDDWHDAEVPLRYGHGAATHYSEDWDEALELRLRTEWHQLYPQHEWVGVRDTVRSGWARGALNRGPRP